LRDAYGWNERSVFGDEIPSMTPIWKDIYAQLPSFRNETKVILGNGRMTAFWLDLWFGSLTLAEMFPALFSHTLHPNASVARVLSVPDLQLSLRPRLTHVATCELLELTALMPSVEQNMAAHDTKTFLKQ